MNNDDPISGRRRSRIAGEHLSSATASGAQASLNASARAGSAAGPRGAVSPKAIRERISMRLAGGAFARATMTASLASASTRPPSSPSPSISGTSFSGPRRARRTPRCRPARVAKRRSRRFGCVSKLFFGAPRAERRGQPARRLVLGDRAGHGLSEANWSFSLKSGALAIAGQAVDEIACG